PLGQPPHLEGRDSALDGELFGVVCEVQRGQIRLRAQADEASAMDLQLEPPAVPGVDAVSNRHRDISIRRLPVVRIVSASEGRAPIDVGNARDGLADLAAVLVSVLTRRERWQQEYYRR